MSDPDTTPATRRFLDAIAIAMPSAEIDDHDAYEILLSALLVLPEAAPKANAPPCPTRAFLSIRLRPAFKEPLRTSKSRRARSSA